MATIHGLGSGWSLGKESVYGTSVSPTRQLPFLSETLRLDIARTSALTLKGGNTIEPSSSWRPGSRSGSGDVQTLLYSSGAAMLFEAMLGTVGTTGAGPYTHTFTPAINLPSYTMQVGYGGVSASDLRKQVVGAKVSSWEIAAVVDENVTLGLTWSYKDETLSVAALVGTVPASQKAYNYIDTVVSGAATPTGCIRAIRYSGNANLRTDAKCLGSATINEPKRNGFQEITGEMEVELDGTTTNYGLWTAGNELALVTTFTESTRTVTITSNVRLDGGTPAVPGPGPIQVTIPFKVHAPTTDASAFTVVAVNGDATP